ncbi:MAG TPA: RNA polymerase factor sigma-54 [Nevskiaceae bacterium]|nr:RNA polymerase factor sigma-54 [Nevskiaceae bacterium]
MALQLGIKTAARQTVTPQLANSIRMLQLDTPTLLAELEQALTQNVMLEREDDAGDDTPADDTLDMDAVWSHGVPEDPREWDEHMADVRSDYIPDHEREYATPAQGLQMRLVAALSEEALSHEVRAAALAVLEEVDGNGRLETPLEEIATRQALPLTTIQAGLQALRVQAPAGYAARSVEECLRLQLRAEAPSALRDDALAVLDGGLLAVGRFGPEGLRRKLGLDTERFSKALNHLRRLELRPGAELEDVPAITPDLLVVKRGGRWQIDLHPSARPRIGINRQYVHLLATTRNSGASALRAQLQDARALLRGLEMRNDTLLKTGRAILRHQFAFLTGGDTALRPLKLRQIADAIAMHESTVSRVTTGKYVQTPRGLFELRHFFSVSLRGDDDASAASAKARIRQLIAAESTKAPLSDAEITRALAAEHIRVVRRTIAKYRKAMGIPTAALRRLASASHSTRRA